MGAIGSRKRLPGLHATTRCSVEDIQNGKVSLLSNDGKKLSLPVEAFPFPPEKTHQVRIEITFEDPHTRKEWAEAFARQGLSDLDVFRRLYELTGKDAPARCHSLHYLQMATEKIAKAYRFAYTAVPLDQLQTRHVAAVEFLKEYFKSATMKARFLERDAQRQEQRKEMLDLGREIEKLAPAVDKESNPQNVEYPWSDGMKLSVPCQLTFPIDQTSKRSINDFITLLEGAAQNCLPPS